MGARKVNSAVDLNVSVGTKILPECRPEPARCYLGRDSFEVLGDEAVEEVLPAGSVGALLMDDLTLDPDLIVRKLVTQAQRLSQGVPEYN